MIIKLTKRAFIQFFASIYDPLGFINPFVVSFCCIIKRWFQKVCISKVNWDAILPPHIVQYDTKSF